MKRTALLFLAALTVAVYGTTAGDSSSMGSGLAQEPQHFCGTRHNPAEIEKAEIVTSARKAAIPDGNLGHRRETIKVHFHIIQMEDEGNVDDATIERQMSVLNRSFQVRGVNFELASVERIVSPGWYLGCHAEGIERQIKSALRIGSADDLNVYTCEPVGALGWATFPSWYEADPVNDGVVLHYGVLPGGRIAQYNTGEVLVHETGHWMNLYHTFQGGCDGNGDYVDDTPAEATPAASCPLGRDTCPSPGLDPTNNYMDYPGDACWTEFTSDQNTRMSEAFAIYRSGQ